MKKLNLLMRRVLLIAALLATLSSALPSAFPAAAQAELLGGASLETGADSAIYLPLIMQRYVPTNPLTVQVVLDPGHRTQQVVPLGGGRSAALRPMARSSPLPSPPAACGSSRRSP